MRTCVVLLTLLAVGCGPSGKYDFISKHGANFVFEKSTPGDMKFSDADAMEDWLLDHVTEYGYDRTKAAESIRNVSVDMLPGAFGCVANYQGKLQWISCDGQQVDAVLNVRSYSCPWESAYRHELLHWFQQSQKGVNDYNHERPEWKLVDWYQNDPCGAP